MSELNVENILKCHRLLLGGMGEAHKQPRDGGTTGALVAGLLSQNTTDHNRDLAYGRLRDRFSTWEEVKKAPMAKISEAIRPAGMMNQRAPRIRSLLSAIKERTGGFSADFLLEIPHEEAFRWLVSRDGIGEKTAAVFLLFQRSAPYFPVDTHIKRVLPRLGWFPPKTPAQKIQRRMTEICPPEIMKDFHLNIIRLGRSTCKPRKPRCPECPAQSICRYFSVDYSGD